MVFWLVALLSSPLVGLLHVYILRQNNYAAADINIFDSHRHHQLQETVTISRVKTLTHGSCEYDMKIECFNNLKGIGYPLAITRVLWFK